MLKIKLLPFLIVPILLSSCQFSDKSARDVVCENYFALVSDFNHKFPNQGDYMEFLKSGYYETFYYNRESGYNCHYHLEYKSGVVVDEWGTYISDGKTLKMKYANAGEKNPYFMYYHSPTIDFHIIDALEYEGEEYKIVYQARYLYSARG